MKRKRGFTLIELLVVITIISILSAVGLASFQNARNRAVDAKAKSEIRAYQQVLESKYNDTTSVYVAAVATDFENGQIPSTVAVTYDGTMTNYCAITAVALKNTTGGNCSAGAAGVCTWAANSTKFCARNMR